MPHEKTIKSYFGKLGSPGSECASVIKTVLEKLSELITYSIFHTKNTKAQEEICFIVRREAEKVFSYLSEQATDPGSPTVSTCHTHAYTFTPNPTNPGNLITSYSSVTTSSLTRHHFATTITTTSHIFNLTTTSTFVSSYQKPTQITIAIMMGFTFNQDIIMISHHNIRGYHIHKTELQAFLEDHSPDVVTLNETFTKKGHKYNMPHYTAVTRNREHGTGGGVAILLRHDLA